MADIKQVVIDNTTYDLKDDKARLGMNIGRVVNASRLEIPNNVYLSNGYSDSFFFYGPSTLITLSTQISVYRIGGVSPVETITSVTSYKNTKTSSNWDPTATTNRYIGTGLYIGDIRDGELVYCVVDYLFPKQIAILTQNAKNYLTLETLPIYDGTVV